jgi:hypothetical protein
VNRAVTSATIVGVLLFVGARAIVVARVTGRSMEPLLHDGQPVVALRAQVLRRRWLTSRGAIVLVRLPAHLDRLEVKRVVGPAKASAGAVELVGGRTPRDPDASERAPYAACAVDDIVGRVVLA